MSIRKTDSVGNANTTPVYCIVCESPCSPLAPSCPKCGHPLAPPVAAHAIPVQYATQPREPERFVRTIEQTGKTWKLAMLLGGLGLFASLVIGAVALMNSREPWAIATMRYAMVLFAISTPVYVGARIGAWWNHG